MFGTRLKALWSRLAMRRADDDAAKEPEPPGTRPESNRGLARLTPAQFAILHREDTERPFSSALNGEKRRGTYHCAACDAALFRSESKFDSGTGWPSFREALPGAFGFRDGYSLLMRRTEYHCARCGGHHGHVFDDGPPPTGKRYCSNGSVLHFVPDGDDTDVQRGPV